MASTPRPSKREEKFEEKDIGPDDSVSMVSASTVSGCALPTPTSSYASTSHRSRSKPSPYITRNAAPGPDKTFIIVDKSENEALAIVEGRLAMVKPPELLSPPPPGFGSAAQANNTFAGACNWHWHCKELDGWLGFRNAATGLWLGSSSRGILQDKEFRWVDLDAARAVLGVDGQFCVRKAEDDEGYVLLKRVDIVTEPVGYFQLPTTTVQLWPVVGRLAMKVEMARVKTRKLAWEFVRVDLGTTASKTTTDGKGKA